MIRGLFDIYSLDKYDGVSCDRIMDEKYGKMIPDNSNIIFISTEIADKKGIRLKNNEIICQTCSNPTIYIHNIDNKHVCPKCSLGIKASYSCNKCYKKFGCESCGGKSNIMVDVEQNVRILLCAKDTCLMKFGYYVNTNIQCTCEKDILVALKEKLPDDIISILKKIIGYSDIWSNIWGCYPKKLGDLTMRKINRCLRCQLSLKYTDMKRCSIVCGDDAVCCCYVSK